MKFIFILFACLFAHSQTFAQTNDPLTPERTTYYMCGTDQVLKGKRTMEMLPAKNYPWGICFSEYAHFNRRERDLTREAMHKWNIEFDNYKIRRWGYNDYQDMVNIPNGKLFIESCDYGKYNIIYPKKENLSSKRWWAYYRSIDTIWDLWTFHGEVVMNSQKNFSDSLFTNVMIHELGHALGLPHVKDHGEGNRHKNLSEFMLPAGLGCENYWKGDICEFTDYDFKTFIQPFGYPQSWGDFKREMEMRRKEGGGEMWKRPWCKVPPGYYCP